MSLAKDISKAVREEFNVTNNPYLLHATSPAAVQLFIALSIPVRQTIKAYCDTLIAMLEVQKGKLLLTVSKADIISHKIESLVTVLQEVMAPVDRFFQMFPVDTVLNELPEITEPVEETRQAAADLIDDFANSTTFKIPPMVIEIFGGLGFDGSDFFSDVNSYQDLRNKVDSLIYKLARSTSLADRAASGIYYFENQIQKLKVYQTIINLIST